MTTTPGATELHRCAGCGAWSLGWCGICRRIASRKAVDALMEAQRAQTLGKAHRDALEAALPGTGRPPRPQPQHA
jgi:hypothetical protein